MIKTGLRKNDLKYVPIELKKPVWDEEHKSLLVHDYKAEWKCNGIDDKVYKAYSEAVKFVNDAQIRVYPTYHPTVSSDADYRFDLADESCEGNNGIYFTFSSQKRKISMNYINTFYLFGEYPGEDVPITPKKVKNIRAICHQNVALLSDLSDLLNGQKDSKLIMDENSDIYSGGILTLSINGSYSLKNSRHQHNTRQNLVDRVSKLQNRVNEYILHNK